jgi:fermentation-respiration switch protein FrsA (DUF1100 family)
MGKTPNTSGLTIYHYADQTAAAAGVPTSTQTFPWAFFTGAARPQASNEGSADWLHEIYVADKGAALGDVIEKFPPQTDPPLAFLTSGASLNASVITSSRGKKKKRTASYLIATNSNPLEANVANELHVSPVNPETLPSGSRLAQLWKLEKTRLQPTRRKRRNS